MGFILIRATNIFDSEEIKIGRIREVECVDPVESNDAAKITRTHVCNVFSLKKKIFDLTFPFLSHSGWHPGHISSEAGYTA